MARIKELSATWKEPDVALKCGSLARGDQDDALPGPQRVVEWFVNVFQRIFR
jgi:hypothetical protein